MNEHRPLPEDDEPVRLEHDDVSQRLRAYRRKTPTATAEIVDLTEAEAVADVVAIPEAEEPRSN